MKRLFTILLCLCLLAGLLAVPAAAVTEDTVVRTISALGIMTGDGSGDLKLADSVTRAQFAKLLAATSSYRDSLTAGGTGYSLYKDVKSDHWATEYIRIAAQEGWMIGYTDGTFRPNGIITREEACTATLRVLGFDSDKLTGSYPYAQLNKAESLGLRKQIAKSKGEIMTRRDCAYLFYNMLTAENSAGQIHATTLGCTVKDGQVDYNAVVRKDLDGPFVAAAGETLPFKPSLVYRDGVLTTDPTISAGEVYYYNTNVKLAWIYTDRASGRITALSPTATSPEQVVVAGKTYAIASQDAAHRLSVLGGGSTDSYVTLLLGMDGEVAGILDTVGPQVASAGETLPFTPTAIYRNGASSTSAALAANDVYYYDASQTTVWIYTDKVSGTVDAVLPKNGTPKSVTVSGTTYQLADQRAADRLTALGEDAEGAFVTVLLGMDGEAADILTASGPFVAAGETLPFTPATVYRNGYRASSSTLAENDVYYYDAAQQSAWIFTEQVTGRIDAIAPKNGTPKTVTVDGAVYTLATDLAADRLIELGENAVDTYVTLLLGMDDGVVDILTGKSLDSVYYGVVQSTQRVATDKGSAEVNTDLSILCTDGKTRNFTLKRDVTFDAGTLVTVTVTKEGASAQTLQSKTLTGTVSTDATKLGSYKFADRVQILDVSSAGGAVTVKASRLAGAVLGSNAIKFYELDSEGRICKLILNDVTGDTWTYVYMTQVSNRSGGMSASGSYRFMQDGAERSLQANGTVYPVQEGGAAIRYGADNTVDSMRQMTSVTLSSATAQTAVGSNRQFTVDENVQVYLKRNGQYDTSASEYYPTTVEAVNGTDHVLTGWYDNFGCAAGGRIRVIIAVPKTE